VSNYVASVLCRLTHERADELASNELAKELVLTLTIQGDGARAQGNQNDKEALSGRDYRLTEIGVDSPLSDTRK
jgi:hypothetical protein